MSQNDFTIADQTFPNFRADLNLALQALASLSSGATAPTVPFANQLWYETDTNTLWIRNELNTAWLDLLRIDQTTGSPSFMSGNVGIGTTSPSRAFHLKNSAAFMRLEDADTGVSTIYAEIQVDTVGSLVLGADSGNAAAGTAIQFYLDASEKARITSTGNVLIGTASGGDRSLSVSKNITGAVSAFGILNNGEIQSDVTSVAQGVRSVPSVVAAHPGLTTLTHYAAVQGTIGAGATVTNQIGFLVESTSIGATKNVGFQANAVTAANVTTGKTLRVMESGQNTATGGGTAHNLYIGGSAPSYFQGNVGLGTDAPARALHVKNTNPSIRLEDTDGGASTIYAEIDATQSGSLFLKADPGNAGAGSNIQFEIDATELLRIGPSGQIGIAGANYGTAGQPFVSGGSGSVAWGPLLSNGTYTPTLTSVANVAASTANVCQWLRVGNTVTVSGSVAVTATAVNTDTEIGISIPVASNFAGGANLGGTGASTSAGTLGQSGAMLADATNDRARFLLRPTVGTSMIYGFSFTYQVI